MKKNVIAIILSVTMIVGFFRSMSLFAAEIAATKKEVITEEEETEALEENSLYREQDEQADTDSEIVAFVEETEQAERYLVTEELSDEASTIEDATVAITDTEIASVIENGKKSVKLNTDTLATTNEDVIASGICGDSANWTLIGTENNITLTISGSGDMADYYVSSYSDNTPWAIYKTGISVIEIQDGINSIGEYAFDGFSNLQSVVIPNSVNEIGSYGFAYCSNVSNLELPCSLITLGDYAFCDCSSLSSIYLPDTLQYLGNSTFENCNSLNSISVPDSVTVFGDNVFSGCSLDMLRIPASSISTSSNSRNTSFLQGVNTIKLIIYGCRVSDGTDSEGGLPFDTKSIRIISDPADVSVRAGENVTFTVKAQGSNLSYRWQWSKDKITWKNSTAVGCNTDTFSFTMDAKYAGRYYRCKVTDGTDTVYSQEGLLSLAESIQIISGPADVSVRAGENVAFTVEAQGSYLRYRWQWSTDGIIWKNSTAAGYDTDTLSFTMDAKYAGRYYRCKITNVTGTVYSSSGLLSIATE